MKYHISTKIMLSFIILIVICVAVFAAIVYSFIFNVLLEKSIEASHITTDKLSNSIDNEIQEIDNISKFFVTSDETIDLIFNKKDKNQNNINYNNFNLYSKIFFTLKPDVERTIISDLEGSNYTFGYNNFIPANYNIKNEKWYNDFWDSEQLYTILSPLNNPGYYNYPIMGMVRKIRAPYTKNNIGILKIDFKLDSLIKIINASLPDKSKIQVFDKKNRLIYSTFENNRFLEEDLYFEENKGYYKTIINRNTYYATYKKSDYSNLTYVLYFPKNNLLVHLPELIKDMLLTALLCILIGSLLAFVIAKPFIKSIKNLAEGMNQVENGNIDYRVPKTSDDEIGYLTTQFNAMSKNIRNLININAEIKSRNIIQEMKVLQSQITPHFLFNALESIRMKAISQKPDTVSYIVEELGDLLRFNLRHRNELISIEKEFFYIKKYINIYNAGSYQQIKIKLPEKNNLKSLMVPKFILQPLIENAITHGLTAKADNRSIFIDLIYNENSIWIQVEDNGIGMEKEKVITLNKAFEDSVSHVDNHIGLTNINKRLKLYFGEESGINISSIRGRGTIVLLKITLN